MDPTPTEQSLARSRSIGVGQALIAYLFWGFGTGVYFKLLDEVDAFELLAWRVLAGLPVMLVLLALPPGYGRIRDAFRGRGATLLLTTSTILITINWFTFIFAVVSGRLVEASLGYYINPLVSVLLGRLFLGERLTSLQKFAIGIAGIGVIIFIWSTLGDSSAIDATGTEGSLVDLPWISIVLPISFGLYGLCRKKMRADAISGLTIEMILLLPFMLALQLFLAGRGETSFLKIDLKTDLLLLAGGVVTVLPLVAFAAAARRLRLTTIGILQYIAPTCQFLLAVLVFGEEVTQSKAAAFVLIWIAVILYAADAWRTSRRTAALEH
ncbi:MAG: EamA family transporter RarD [Phycisphaerales bacterium]|jgi:chloramphenicol-sensitive protein RarD|nr:EamA family transporter RarD [Phycisphaerales bacterium]